MSEQIPDGLIVRCHDCGGTQIWKRKDAGEIEVYHGCFNGKQSREAFAALTSERDELKAKVEKIRHPKVYEGAVYYTQAEVPEICPECDGRNFVSSGVKGMVCWACCLMRDLELVESENSALKQQVERLSAPVTDAEATLYCHYMEQDRKPHLAIRFQDVNALIASRTAPAPQPTTPVTQERAVYACAIHNMQNGWCIVCGASDHDG